LLYPGLGDAVIMTSLPVTAYKYDRTLHIKSSNNVYLKPLLKDNCYQRITDTNKNTISNSVFPLNNWGGGHPIQLMEKALGFEPSLKPKGYINKNINPIENKLFHKMIAETHNMYFRLNEENVEMKIDSKLTEQIETYLDEDNNFVDDVIYEFKYYLIDVLINFKSTNINYNNIKIEILTNEMNEAVKIDDYDNAIFFRDIINDTKKKIEKKIDK
jgi:hypothetical protein